MLRIICFFVFLLIAPALRAQELNNDPQGAVLCTWTKYVELISYGTVCGFDADTGLQPVLADAIARMDKFITENSGITQSQLNEKKNLVLIHQKEEAARATPNDLAKACSGLDSFIGGAYLKLKDTDPEQIRAGIARLLAVPRKPVMEPCS
ncbi:MAG: hypothetical protein AB7H77_07700 [Bdellovibrionales bacterium]